MKHILFIFYFIFLSFHSFSQCPSSISSLGVGNGLQVCWNSGEAPAVMDSITYDDITYAGEFVNAGAGDCWRTTDAATLGVNGNHEIEFEMNGVHFVCQIVDGTVDPVPQILSVEYVYFEIEKVNNNVSLIWETAEEENNDFFVVERSVDGITFNDIATVPGNGYASGYRYEDLDASFYSGTYYYRLKQVDFDGVFEYSALKVVSLDFEKTAELQVFPNPADNEIFIKFDRNNESELSIVVYNLSGQSVIQVQNVDSGDAQVSKLNLEILDPGFYIVELSNDEYTQRQQFVKR